MIENVFFNRFVLQVVISTVPTVLVLGSLPLLARLGGIPAERIGVLFFLSRLGSIGGAQAGPWVLKRLVPRHAAAGAEFLNALFCLGLFLGAAHRMPALIFPCLFLKGISTGLLHNCRVSWLKALPVSEAGRRILIVIQVIGQSSYALVGLLLISGVAQSITLTLVLADLVSSVVAVPIFLSMGDLGVDAQAKPEEERIAFRFLFAPQNRSLLGADLSLAVALGGTNMFLVRAGEGLFQPVGGYGFALMGYAFAYMLGGLLVQSHAGAMLGLRRRVEPLAPWCVLGGLALLALRGVSPLILAAGFCLLFVAYPVYLLSLETRWFVTSTPANIGRTFATRVLLVNLIWALGEVFYSRMPLGRELAIRLTTIAVSTFVFLRYTRSIPWPDSRPASPLAASIVPVSGMR